MNEEKTNEPNLFDFATKELHQDAFIAWLISWANPKNKYFNEKLHECAVDFVKKLVNNKDAELDNVHEIKVKRQYKNIDVFVEINNDIVLVIEDKTNSSRHGNQLENYQNIIKKEFPNHRNIFIYLKTGDETNHELEKIQNIGYKVYDRKNYISFFNDHIVDVNNDVVKYFYERLKKLENNVNQWEGKKVDEWNNNDFIGFFQFIEKNEDDKKILKNWSYVPQKDGGFWNAVLLTNKLEIPVYLQVECRKNNIKISYKANTSSNTTSAEKSNLRNSLYRKLIENKEYLELSLNRPKRFGNGKTMTLLETKNSDWLVGKDGLVNKSNVISSLKKHISFLEKFTFIN
jgi:hypothetical protein